MIRRPVREQQDLTLDFAGLHLWLSNPHVRSLTIHIRLVVCTNYSCQLKSRCPSHLYVSWIPCLLLICQWMLLSDHRGCLSQLPASTSHFRCLHLLTVADSNPYYLPSHSMAMNVLSKFSKLGLPTPSFFRALVEERDAQIWHPSKPAVGIVVIVSGSGCFRVKVLWKEEREDHFHTWSRSLSCLCTWISSHTSTGSERASQYPMWSDWWYWPVPKILGTIIDYPSGVWLKLLAAYCHTYSCDHLASFVPQDYCQKKNAMENIYSIDWVFTCLIWDTLQTSLFSAGWQTNALLYASSPFMNSA